MSRIPSLQRRNEPGRVNYPRAAAALPVRACFLATLFLENFDSAVKARSLLPRNDLGLSPFRYRSASIVSANSDDGGQRPWR
jgi:hypothetical protein